MSANKAARHARAADLRHLAGIEDAGLALFEERFGDLTGAALAAPAPTGGSRLDAPGFLLVIGPVGDPVGFAHVLDIDGYAHLEQLSVRPDAMRRGIGTTLVRAAANEAYALGFAKLSLCTYRDLPWNGPFYAERGFTVADSLEPFQERLRAREVALGLDRHGARVVMTNDLATGTAGVPVARSIEKLGQLE